MVPGVRGGTAGALALLALLVYLLLTGGGDDGGGSPSGGGPGASSREPVAARVVRAIDGDTIEVAIDGGTDDVRYIGVDTPETVKPGEPVQCYGPEASAFNHELVDGETVRLVFDRELRDVYGRLLAYVYADGEFVNAELVRGGYARTLEIPPNTAEADRLNAIERAAADAGVGLWGAC
ncbi:MAG: thermonuclease family protein [Solirubrobacterales bacterium]